MGVELNRLLTALSLSWLQSRRFCNYSLCFVLMLTTFIAPVKVLADMSGDLNGPTGLYIGLHSYHDLNSEFKHRYSLLDNGTNDRFSFNLQFDNKEQAYDRFMSANDQKSEYIETRILVSHEVIKFLAGSLLLVIGTLTGTIIAIHGSSTKTCGGNVCTEGPSPDLMWVGILSGGVLGASTGVTWSAYALHEDGNFLITAAGSIALPFLLVFISDPSLSNIPPWTIEGSFPAMLVGAMAAYDLSRTHSKKKGVSLLYYPLINVKKDKGNNLDVAVNMVELSF